MTAPSPVKKSRRFEGRGGGGSEAGPATGYIFSKGWSPCVKDEGALYRLKHAWVKIESLNRFKDFNDFTGNIVKTADAEKMQKELIVFYNKEGTEECKIIEVSLQKFIELRSQFLNELENINIYII
jgi:hypothetical protein